MCVFAQYMYIDIECTYDKHIYKMYMYVYVLFVCAYVNVTWTKRLKQKNKKVDKPKFKFMS